MKEKLLLSISLLLMFVLSACIQPIDSGIRDGTQEPSEVDVAKETNEIKVDNNNEEIDVEPIKEVSPEIVDLLNIADEKVKSLKYDYKGPETAEAFYTFYIKGNLIKYTFEPTSKFIDAYDDAYDTIYFNKDDKTAMGYCDNKKCKVKGKKADLSYDEVYILTSLDWLDEIKFAEKIGEQLIDKRNTWKLSTEEFTIWIDTFFGVPMQVESGDNIIQFKKMDFKNLKDEDVNPIS